MNIVTTTVIVLLTVLSVKCNINKKVICEFYDKDVKNSSPTVAKEMMICGKESKFCYALWTSDHDNDETFIKQGCWEASPPLSNPNNKMNGIYPKSSSYCQRSNCTGYVVGQKPNSTVNMHFCCCQGDGCNSQVYLEQLDFDDDKNIYDSEFDYNILNENSNYSYYLIGLMLFIGFGFITMGILIKLNIKNNKTNVNQEEQEEFLQQNPTTDFMNLKRFKQNIIDINIDNIIDKQIGGGRWGRIYSTKKDSSESSDLFEKSLALKLYSHEHREFYENEKFIYECLGNEHEHILKYYGAFENPNHLCLTFDLIDYNLRDFLKNQSINLKQTINICHSISNAVAYLHAGNKHNNTAIAHRDLTSRNILISSMDQRIYLADFGLSLLTRGSKYYWGGRERQAEFCSLAEAGTLRYMAPELLEGAVNLKDCENALKQADVYSLSLVLWEVANSCSEIRSDYEEGDDDRDTNNEGVEQSEVLHALPYDEEAGHKDMCLDEVVRLVVLLRSRPGFYNWYDMLLTRSLRDTLNESWDSEPDARLTSLCIVERISELKQNLINNKFITLVTNKNLEKKINKINLEEQFWINRNTCLERNLLFDNCPSNSSDYIVGVPSMGVGGSTNSFTDNSAITVTTNLSESYNNSEVKINNVNVVMQPKAIQLIQNIKK